MRAYNFVDNIFQKNMKASTTSNVNFKPKWEIKTKLQRFPTRRWGHTSILKNKKLIIYGGKTGRPKEPLYQIDCDTLESQILDCPQGYPETRQSHSCCVVGERLMIWGGCRHQKALGDGVFFDIKGSLCEWTPTPPSPVTKRESHGVVVLKEKYVVLLGGCIEDDIYDDCWVYNNDLDVWLQIHNIESKISKRVGFTLNVINDNIFLFGGQSEDGIPNNHLYRLTFSHLDFVEENPPTLHIQLIEPKTKSPMPRSSHAAIVYENRFLVVLGGEGLGTVKGDQTSVLLNDIWVYDVMENVWSEVAATNKNFFKPRSCFTANLYKNKVFVFGGIVSLNSFRPSDEFCVLSLIQSSERKPNLCNICKLYYISPDEDGLQQEKQAKIPSKGAMNFPVKNIFKFANTIKNCFEAFRLLFEGFCVGGFNILKCDYIQGNLVMLQALGRELQDVQFQEFMMNYNIPDEVYFKNQRVKEVNQELIKKNNFDIFTYNIKNACARIGNTILIVNIRGKFQDMLLISVQNIFYCQYLQNEKDIPTSQQKSYEVIKNFIKNHNLNFTLLTENSFNIIVANLRGGGPGLCELKQVDDRIELTGSRRQTDLKTYLQTFFFRKPEFSFFLNSEKIQFNTQEQNQCNWESEIRNDFLSWRLKQRESQGVILVYRGNYQVGRYIRHKPPFFEGYFEVPQEYELNILRNKLEYSVAVEKCMDSIIIQYYKQSKKRYAEINLHELQNGNQ